MIYYRKTLFGCGPKLTAVQGGQAHIQSFAPPRQIEKYEAIDKAVEDCGFRSVYKNVDFEILMKAKR